MGARFAVRPRGTSTGSEVVYEFDQERVVIGRGHGSDVRLPHPSVSQTHATVRQQGVGYVLVDGGSTNGTWVGGQPVVPGRPKPLRTGDTIDVGAFRIVFDAGVPVSQGTSAERTAALARRLIREVWEGEAKAGGARLMVVQGPDAGSELAIPAPPARLRIGRGESCDLRLGDADVSREHLEVTVDLDGVTISDLDSKNGMTVNGRGVGRRRLKDRDEIALGATVLAFDEPAERRLAELEAQGDLEVPPPTPIGTDPSEPDATPDAALSTPAPQKEMASAPAPVPRPRFGADVIIYLLAGSVLALSLAGLFLLLQG